MTLVYKNYGAFSLNGEHVSEEIVAEGWNQMEKRIKELEEFRDVVVDNQPPL